MQIDPDRQSIREFYGWMVRLIAPRPIAWVSTLSTEGIANLAPYSFFNGVGANPPTIVFCPANRRDGSPKDTLANIRARGEFVVNMVTENVAEAMNGTSAEYEPDVDEFTMTATPKEESVRVGVPRVATAAAALECRLHHAVQLGIGPGGANLVVGRIVWVHVDESLLDEAGGFCQEHYRPVGRLGGNGYVKTTDRFELDRPPRPTR